MRVDSASRFYELMVIAAPEGTPEELVGVVDQITGYVEGAGGSILRANYDSPWGRRRLAYPIRHESHDVRDGFYTLMHLQLEPDKVITVERDLKLNDRLMRYLVLQLPGEPVFPEPEVETGGEGGEAPAGAGAEATVVPSESTSPEAPSPVDEPTAAPPVEPATSEETAESRRTLVADAGTDSVEEAVVPETAPDSVESESAGITSEDVSEPVVEITEVPADADGENTEEKE